MEKQTKVHNPKNQTSWNFVAMVRNLYVRNVIPMVGDFYGRKNGIAPKITSNQPTGLEPGGIPCLQLNFRSFQFTQGRLQLLGGLHCWNVRGFCRRGKIGNICISNK